MKDLGLRDYLNTVGNLVVLVSDEYPPDTGFGGIGSYTQNMAKGLAAAGCRVVVISRALTASKITIVNGIAVIRLGESRLMLRILFKLLRLLRINRTGRSLIFGLRTYWQLRKLRQLSEIFAVEGPEWNAQLFWLSVAPGWSYLVRIHTPLAKIMELDELPRSLDNRISLWMEQRAVQRAAAVLYASDVSLRDAQRFWSLQKKELVKVPLPVDTGLFNETNTNPMDRSALLYVGRLEVKKGILIFLAAMRKVVSTYPGVRAIVVGSDGNPHHGGKSASQLQDMCRAWGIGDAVDFLGIQPYDQLPQIMREARLHINPSSYESFGMTSLEAVACGARTLIGPSVGFGEWLLPEMGLIVPSDDPEQWSDEILRSLESRQQMSASAQVAERFGMESVALQVIEVYGRYGANARI